MFISDNNNTAACVVLIGFLAPSRFLCELTTFERESGGGNIGTTIRDDYIGNTVDDTNPV